MAKKSEGESKKQNVFGLYDFGSLSVDGQEMKIAPKATSMSLIHHGVSHAMEELKRVVPNLSLTETTVTQNGTKDTVPCFQFNFNKLNLTDVKTVLRTLFFPDSLIEKKKIEFDQGTSLDDVADTLVIALLHKVLNGHVAVQCSAEPSRKGEAKRKAEAQNAAFANLPLETRLSMAEAVIEKGLNTWTEFCSREEIMDADCDMYPHIAELQVKIGEAFKAMEEAKEKKAEDRLKALMGK